MNIDTIHALRAAADPGTPDLLVQLRCLLCEGFGDVGTVGCASDCRRRSPPGSEE